MKSGFLRILERWSRYGGRTAECDAGSEAERFCGARRYERGWARQDARANSYEKTLHLDAACRGPHGGPIGHAGFAVDGVGPHGEPAGLANEGRLADRYSRPSGYCSIRSVIFFAGTNGWHY